MALNGIILVNKERGVSSNKVVGKVKHLLKAEKAGHLGTLDVLGEGLLPITLGKGTKLFEYFLNKDKVYITTFKFGETTATLDLEGEIIQKNDVVVSLQQLKQVVKCFIGKQNQMPPVYSAKKIKGRKAYELAREGERVELKPKEVEIYSIKVLEEVDKNTYRLQVHCSSGTYIRSLCRDIAEKISTYGVMQNIIRTKCGEFELRDSYTLSDIENGKFNLIRLETLFDYESLYVDKAQSDKLLNGVFLKGFDKDGEFKIFDENSFLGIGRVRNGELRLVLRLI